MRSAPLLVSLSIIAAPMILSSCGGGEESAAPTTEITSSGQIDVSLDPVELPAGFPTEVPLPELVVLEVANELVGESSTIYEVTGWHDGEPVPLGEAYLAALGEAGFEVTSRSDTPTRTFYVVQGEDWFVSAGFFPDPIREDGTSIGVTVGPASSSPTN